MAAFQDHFHTANLDRLSTATTGTAIYHGSANHTADQQPQWTQQWQQWKQQWQQQW
jgi:hypothetical protein